MAVDGIYHTPAAGGCAAAEDRGGEMEIGTYLQFLKSQGPLGKQKIFSIFLGSNEKSVKYQTCVTFQDLQLLF